MKYAVLIPMGGGDEPLDALGGRTPLSAAAMPRTSAMAAVGRVALVRTVEGEPWAGAGLIGVLDAEGGGGARGAVSEGSLRALGSGLEAPATAWVYSLGWAATEAADGSPSAGDTARVAEWDESTLTGPESDAMWSEVAAAWQEAEPGLAGVVTIERAGGAWVLIDRGVERDHGSVTTHAPWRVLGEGWRSVEPGGGDAEAAWLLRRVMHVGSGVLATHDVNASRMERGLPLITMPWPWGGGRIPAWGAFLSRFKLRGTMVTDEALAAAVGRAIGWSVREASGEEALGAAAVDALGSVDVVCVCAGGARRASVEDDAARKVRALEAFDAGVVGPVAARLQDFGDPEADAEARGWRLLMLPDAVWPTGEYEPGAGEVPALMAGAWMRSVVRREMTEESAAESDLRISTPGGLMEFFLLGGLAKAKAVGRKKDEAGTLWEMDA